MAGGFRSWSITGKFAAATHAQFVLKLAEERSPAKKRIVIGRSNLFTKQVFQNERTIIY